ncbi:MAG: PIG-L family deacetylase [Nocardioidaceae bacterium]
MFTLVAFHAHPDDETLLTGGTLADAASRGHRVVLVTATEGEAGLAADAADAEGLGSLRATELQRAAEALGCARVVQLAYPDSGWDRPVPGPRFADLDPAEPAERLAAILREEHADVLTVYDPRGGYGHPDHVQVHRVGVRAAELAGTPRVLEATVDRTSLVRLAAVMRWVPGLRRLVPPDGFAGSFTAREELTHCVDVRPSLAAKRAALRAHHSQAGGGSSVRTAAALLRLPTPVLGLVLGREWFVERGRAPAVPLLGDVFAGLDDGGR